MRPTLDVQAMQKEGAAALERVRTILMRGRPPETAEFFEIKWQMLTRLSWAAADRVVRSGASYRLIGREVATHFGRLLFSRAAQVPHADRWLERHDRMLWGMSEQIAEEVDRALEFPWGVTIVVDLDRRGHITQRPQALRDEIPEELQLPAKRKRRALVRDERVTERALDAIAATFSPEELRAE